MALIKTKVFSVAMMQPEEREYLGIVRREIPGVRIIYYMTAIPWCEIVGMTFEAYVRGEDECPWDAQVHK